MFLSHGVDGDLFYINIENIIMQMPSVHAFTWRAFTITMDVFTVSIDLIFGGNPDELQIP